MTQSRVLLPSVLGVAIALVIAADDLTAQRAESAGDAVRGEQLFQRHCSGCHALHENRHGPRLGDVVGRPVATVSGYRYSPALRTLSFVWNDSLLNVWLAGPRDVVRGAAMPARVKDAHERADIIAYLRRCTP